MMFQCFKIFGILIIASLNFCYGYGWYAFLPLIDMYIVLFGIFAWVCRFLASMIIVGFLAFATRSFRFRFLYWLWSVAIMIASAFWVAFWSVVSGMLSLFSVGLLFTYGSWTAMVAPFVLSIFAISIAGDSLVSETLPLNAAPRMAIFVFSMGFLSFLSSWVSRLTV